MLLREDMLTPLIPLLKQSFVLIRRSVANSNIDGLKFDMDLRIFRRFYFLLVIIMSIFVESCIQFIKYEHETERVYFQLSPGCCSSDTNTEQRRKKR